MMADHHHEHHHAGHDHHHEGHDHHHEGHAHHPGSHDHHHDGHVHHHHDHEHVADIDRCEGIEFDAIAPDAHGIIRFFKGDHMWTGFHGPAEWINGSFKELEEHHAHLGLIDAAICLHHSGDEDHKHMFFFMSDMVFSYHNHTLEEGFPKNISEVFPGLPSHIDAAVECPKGECVQDSVIFFKGCEVFHYNIHSKTMKTSHWSHLPNCTSVLRWQSHYYCFHGHQFTKFHPVTGSVAGTYPRDARGYFMKCSNFGGVSNETERERCSHQPLDAISSIGLEQAIAFRGDYILREDEQISDGWHAFPIAESFKEVQNNVNAVFSYEGLLSIIKGDQVFVYKAGKQHELVEGYPKTLKEELGIEGPVDATFVCGEYPLLHVIKGRQMFDIDLNASPRAVTKEVPLLFPKVDAAMCGPEGIKVFVGAEYYAYESLMLLVASRIRPEPHQVSLEMFGCDH